MILSKIKQKINEIIETIYKIIILKPFRTLAIIGMIISMSMYVSTIWLEAFVCNPTTQNMSLWIHRNMSFIFLVNDNPPLLDTILFIGLIMALIGTFFVYKEKKGKVYGAEKTLYIYSVFVAIMVFFTVDVTKWLATTFFGVGVSINGFPSWNYGFPTWTYQVTTITNFFKYSDFTTDNPNSYFLNYWQLFVICISIAVITKLLIIRQEKEKKFGVKASYRKITRRYS
jgi:hypothetical protein